MKRYDSYKDSGVEWIGEIPKGWLSLMIKRLSPVKRGASPRPIDDPKYFDTDGEFAWVRIADVSASERYLETTTQTLSELGASLSVKRYPGDIFLSIAGTVGKPIISKIKCCIHDGFVYFPKLQINPEYLYYLFSTGLPYQGLGKWGTQLNLNTDTVGEIVIPIPSKNEMSDVVAFLDRRTAEIDQLIANKEKLIALYEEEKTAIINRAVTKGLDPAVKTRPSGIDWLGDIPEHWVILKLKHIVEVKDGTHDTPQYIACSENSFPLVTSKDVKSGSIDFSECKYISIADYESIQKRSNVTINDIIMPMIGSVGGAVVVNTADKFAIKNVALFKTSTSDIESAYLRYFLDSMIVKTQFAIEARGGVQEFVSLNILKNITCFNLDRNEQSAIVAHIETECTRLDTIIDKFKKQIELFKEYRTTLISEVVTGKIDVRGEVGV